MKPILEIQHLSKRFMIDHESAPYLSLRERLTRGIRFNKIIHQPFWALQDISFDVYPGDSLGIIGKNGAGKSTLLKILSKITPPTAGKIICRGRIASLLEVGTGFHPELSGRENVYLNGSILGMRKREIDKHFDEIIDFAGTENFLDTALKHYSSGMQLRLAFSVAAFLEPEILIIDEVLAVGDTEFQKKCLRKMEDVSRSGRTILFVSHNMEAVRALCTKGILLDEGTIKLNGPAEEVIRGYLKKVTTGQQTFQRFEPPLEGNGFMLMESRLNTNPLFSDIITNGLELQLNFKLRNPEGKKFSLYLFVYRDESLAFLASDLHDPAVHQLAPDKNEFDVTFVIPKYFLNPGHCRIGLMIADYNGNTEQYFNNMDLLNFNIEDDGVRRGNRYNLGWSGAVSPILKISVQGQ